MATVKVLCLTEIRQVLVICKDLDGEGRAMEIMSPRLQGTDDGKKLSVVDVVIVLRWDE